MTLTFQAFPPLLYSKERPEFRYRRLECHGAVQRQRMPGNVTDADSEASSLMIAANIPGWIVKRPERRAPYARRVFGPRCQTCRAKLIKELHA